MSRKAWLRQAGLDEKRGTGLTSKLRDALVEMVIELVVLWQVGPRAVDFE